MLVPLDANLELHMRQESYVDGQIHIQDGSEQKKLVQEDKDLKLDRISNPLPCGVAPYCHSEYGLCLIVQLSVLAFISCLNIRKPC